MEQQRIYGNLTLNLSLPLSLATFSDLAHPKEDNASQLVAALASHISTNLTCPGSVYTLLKSNVNSSLAINDRAVVASAIETLAADFAHRLVKDFPYLLARQIELANGGRPRPETKAPEPEPQTAQEYTVYLDGFIEKNLAEFYKPSGEFVTDLAKRAANRAQAVSNELCLLPEHASGLAKLALYDFIILCDNSTSMLEDGRMPALQDMLQRVAKFTTVLNPDGISVRLLNYVGDENGQFDRLRTVEDIKKLANVNCSGDTRLGEILNRKIVKPMILDKAKKGTFKKPVIVVIITDGEPCGEPRETLRNTIRACKTSIETQGYKGAAVVFLISRVGTSEDAKKFLEELRNDQVAGHMMYTSPLDLNEKREVFRECGIDAAYTALLIELFLTALDSQTEPRG